MVMDRKTLFFVVAIIALSACLQLYKLTTYPIGFHVDEVRIGNAAWSFAQTGKDFWGHPLAFYYDTFGDNRPTGLIYLTIPFVALLGLTEFAVRLPSAVFSILTVPAIMYCTYLLFRKKDIALASGFFLGTSPWLVILGRSTSESIISLFLFILSFTCFIKASQTNRRKFLTYGTIFASLSFLFYHSPRVFVPMFLGISIPVLFFKSKLFLSSIIHWVLMLAVVGILVLVVPGGMGRIKQTAFLTGPEVTDKITKQLQEEGPNKILQARIFHNKGIIAATVFVQNYMRHFSGDFLFFDGGKPLRYNAEDFGLLYIVTAPFLLLGLLVIVHEKKSGILLLSWILLSPVVAAATAGFQPNVQRGVFLLPALTTLTGIGFCTFLKWKQTLTKRAVLALFSIALLCNGAIFFHQYTIHRTGLHKNERDVNNTLLAKYIASIYKQKNQNIIVATRLVPTYEHVLFYKGFDPKAFQTLGDVRGKMMWSFGQLTFYEDFCPSMYADTIKKDDAVFFDFALCKLPNNVIEIGTIADGKEDIYFRIRTIKK